MFRGILAIILKELLQIRRDPATRFVFLIPVVQTIIFGFAIDMDVKHVPLAVFDMSRTQESRRLTDMFEQTRSFDIVARATGEREIRRLIVDGVAKAGLIIPPDYGAKILRGEQASVQVLIDGSDATVASNSNMTASLIGEVRSLALRSASGADQTPVEARPGDPYGGGASALAVEVRPRVLFNPDLLSSHFYVPGLVGIILQLITVMLTAFSIVRERERGTLEQLLVTPVSRLALITGKLVPYVAIGMAQAVLALVVMRFVFGVHVAGDVFLLLSLSALFLLPSLALGILVSTVASNQAQATQLGLLIMLPSVLLSGFAFPRESMPAAIHAVTYFIPVTYYVQIVRNIVMKGAGFESLWQQTLALSCFAIVFIGLSVLRFKKRIG